MIELKYSHVRNPEFQGAFSKLVNVQQLPTKVTCLIAQIKKAFDKEVETAQECFIKLLKNHANLDEKGNFVELVVGGAKQPGTYSIPEEKQAQWMEALKEFGETTFNVERRKILMQEISEVKFSAAELIALEPLLSDMEVMDGGKQGLSLA